MISHIFNWSRRVHHAQTHGMPQYKSNHNCFRVKTRCGTFQADQHERNFGLNEIKQNSLDSRAWRPGPTGNSREPRVGAVNELLLKG